MSIRKSNFVPGEFYHVYNRGTDKRVIFQDRADFDRFQSLLYLLNTESQINVRDVLKNESDCYLIPRDEPLVAVGAYCLMPNHFHILLTPNTETGLSLFMQKVSTSYSMYFNRKYERTGSLFEGKFKAQLVSDNRYMKYLYSYIHLNPIKLFQSDWKEAGLKDVFRAKKYLDTYDYSSYHEMLGRPRNQSAILSQDKFPDYFTTVAAAQREINDWLFTP